MESVSGKKIEESPKCPRKAVAMAVIPINVYFIAIHDMACEFRYANVLKLEIDQVLSGDFVTPAHAFFGQRCCHATS